MKKKAKKKTAPKKTPAKRATPRKATATAASAPEANGKLTFNHAMIYVKDVERGLGFYRDLLGFKLIEDFRYEGVPVYARRVAIAPSRFIKPGRASLLPVTAFACISKFVTSTISVRSYRRKISTS